MVTNDEYYESTPAVKIAYTAPFIALNELGLSHKEDPWTGEEYTVYRIRDIDFRGRRTDSNENTRSFGTSANIWQLEHQVCQFSPLLLGAAEYTTRDFVYACATDPILARLLFIASVMCMHTISFDTDVVSLRGASATSSAHEDDNDFSTHFLPPLSRASRGHPVAQCRSLDDRPYAIRNYLPGEHQAADHSAPKRTSPVPRSSRCRGTRLVAQATQLSKRLEQATFRSGSEHGASQSSDHTPRTSYATPHPRRPVMGRKMGRIERWMVANEHKSSLRGITGTGRDPSNGSAAESGNYASQYRDEEPGLTPRRDTALAHTSTVETRDTEVDLRDEANELKSSNVGLAEVAIWSLDFAMEKIAQEDGKHEEHAGPDGHEEGGFVVGQESEARV
ncbi:hypothetical protein L227DRAFT_603758 [Lentinus tigrinus ALCF2SS1-6]|uniref:Uncharacterized protein n=1 Tax=Lentinus tigrinus ALCF2SS1-6 TaxID=1328759 RepID=A0A5C2RVJ1_9APHY|nr:hypothetical protein L227DRAFT_603758 [Lentinus tigrinus ALCF2SS1-6]